MQSSRSSIIEEDINVGENFKKFSNDFVFNKKTDFSDRIDSIKNNTFETKHGETVYNRIDRLRKELIELQNDINEDDDEKSDLEVEKQIKDLKELFDGLNLKVKNQRLLKLNVEPEKIENEEVVETVVMHDPTKFLKIEDKLSEIEKIIGIDLSLDNKLSIEGSINDLYRKIKLISNDSGSIERISTLIDDINLKFEKSIAIRRSIFNSNDEEFIKKDEKINEIYNKFNKLKNFENDLPLLINRLESLNDLHFQMNDVLEINKNFNYDFDIMEKNLKSWNESLNGLETQIEALNKSFSIGCDEILAKLNTKSTTSSH